MANTVIELRNSYVSGNVPSSLANGEIAINTYDGKLFYRGGVSNTIQTIERYQGPAGLNGEIQFNDSGVLGANANLSFNKTTGLLSARLIQSTQSVGDEGGQLDLSTAATNQSLSGGSVAIDIYQNKLRIFETGGTNRGVYIDMANGASAGVGTDLLNPTATPDTVARAQANAAFITANAAFTAANSAGVYANGAFTRANNSLNANTGGTISGNITVVGNVTANLISLKTDGIVPIELLSDNTVSSFKYTGKSFSVSSQETVPTGVHFKPDGTKMFIVGSTGDDINEYALSTPWEVTTATFTRVTAALTDTSPQSLRFSSDGLSAYVLGDTNDTIYQHTLTEAWNIATLNTTATNTFNVGSQETAPTGLWFNPDGTKMFVVGTSGDDINEYNLSSAGNVATASFVQTGSLASPTGSTADTAPSSVAFNDDGTRLFVSGSTGEELNEYILSTAFNVSTIRWVSYRYTGFESPDPTGIFPALSNNFFYIVSSSGDAVYQYSTNANSLVANTHNFNARGNVTIDYDQTIMGKQFVQGAAAFYGSIAASDTASFSSTLTGTSTLSLTGATNSVTVIGTAATTGTTRIGGSTQTGEITIGFSTQNQTLNVANGATTSTNTKTVYLGAAGLSGSQTNVIIGSTISGSRGNTHIFTPNVLITAANTAQTSIRILGGQASISNSTGTIIVNGGIGVNGSIYADAIYDGGVEIIGFSNAAFNTANGAVAVNLTQNNSITAAFTAANSAGVYANGAFTRANNSINANTGGTITGNTTIVGNLAITNSTTSISNTTGALKVSGGVGVTGNVYADAVYDGGVEVIAFANNAFNTANAAFLAANAATATDTTQNTSITAAFTAANSAGVYANGAFTRANNSLNANTGGTISGDLVVTGNLVIQGNTFTANAGILVANDTLILLGTGNYTTDVLDIGFAGHYNAGINAHTGFIRDSVSKEWFLFKNYTPEVGANNNINTNDASFTIDTLNANLKSSLITLNNQNLSSYVNSAFNTANAAFIAANAATATDTTQNTSITAAFTAANSAGVYANGAFAAANAATATDATQNTSITAAFTAANSAGVYANGAFTKANTDVTDINITDSRAYGNATHVPIVTVTANGRINAISTVAVTATDPSAIAFAIALG